jgi:hypothetical protein
MTLPDLLVSCARLEGGIKKISTLSYVSYPYFECHSVVALYLLYTENGIEKNRGELGAGIQRQFIALPPTVRG